MTQPKISVIIPVYNVEQYLDTCLASAVNQSLKEIEIIAVNDGSTDSSPKIIEKYASKDGRLKIVNKKNEGLPWARKSGLERAEGEFVFHLDGDDFLDEQALEKLYNKAIETSADIVVSDFNYLHLPSNEVTPWLNEDFKTTGNIGFLKHLLTNKCNLSIWGKLYRRTLYTENNITIPKDIVYGEDAIANIQLGYFANRIAKVNHFTVYYVQNDTSITRKKLSPQGLKNFISLPYFIEDFLTGQNVKDKVAHELDVFFVNNFMWILGAKGYKGAHDRSKVVMKKMSSNPRLSKEIAFGTMATIYAFSKSQGLGLFLKVSVPRLRNFFKKLPLWLQKTRFVESF